MTAYIYGLILFTGIINGECDFSYDLLNDPALSPADPTIFTITQPTLTSVPGAMDPRIKSVADSGNLKVTATNAHAGVYKLLLRINSDKSPYDIAERYIRFTVTIREWRCTPKITAPILHDQYSFKIQKGSKAHNIEFTGLSNGDCLFSTQLVLPTLSFSYIPEVITVDALNNNKFVVSHVPILVVSPTELEAEKIYNLTLQVTSLAPGDTSVQNFTFEIKLYNNPCVPKFPLLMTIAPIYFVKYDTVTIVDLEWLSCGDCRFELSVYEGLTCKFLEISQATFS